MELEGARCEWQSTGIIDKSCTRTVREEAPDESYAGERSNKARAGGDRSDVGFGFGTTDNTTSDATCYGEPLTPIRAGDVGHSVKYGMCARWAFFGFLELEVDIVPRI